MRDQNAVPFSAFVEINAINAMVQSFILREMLEGGITTRERIDAEWQRMGQELVARGVSSGAREAAETVRCMALGEPPPSR